MSKKGIELLKTFDDNGNVTFSDLPNMMQLDYIKALGELSENARGEFERTPDSDMFGNMAFQLKCYQSGKS